MCQKLDAVVAKIGEVTRAIETASTKLGASHPVVEKARENLRQLKSEEATMRWDSMVRSHALALADAVGRGEIDPIRAAIRSAAESELGPGHEIVLSAKAELETLLKKNQRERHEEAEAFHIQQMVTSAGLEDVEGLHVAMEKAALALGGAHPAVEAARLDYKALRDTKDREEYEWLLQKHTDRINAAVAAEDPERLQVALREAVESRIGPSHAVVLAGKKQCDKLRKARIRQKTTLCTKAATAALKQAMERNDIQTLQNAIRSASDVLGHRELQEARKRVQTLRESQARAGKEKLSHKHREAIALHHTRGDAKALEHAIHLASRRALGPAHSIVEQGKRWLQELKKRQRKKVHTNEDAENQLLAELVEADDAMGALKLEMGYAPTDTDDSRGRTDRRTVRSKAKKRVPKTPHKTPRRQPGGRVDHNAPGAWR